MLGYFSRVLRKNLFLSLALLLLGCSQKAVKSPEWARDTTIYEVYLRAFSREGTLEKLRERLPTLRELGIGTIWLMPIHPIGERGRKGSLGCPYSIRDYYAINSEYGTKEDLRRLVEDAHRLGMKVILDFVANHASNDYVEMKDNPDWFMRDKEGKFTREVTDWWDITDLNYDNSDLREYMKGVAKYWVKEFKVDGYRCDVAGMVPLKFWVGLRQELKSINPNMFLLAEWESPKMHLRAFDATYDWSLYHLLIKVRKGKVKAEKAIDLVLEKERKYPANSLRLRFIENHDEKRAIEVFSQESFKPFAAFIFTISGIPLIYNGQEIGERKRPSLFEKEEIGWDKGDYGIRDYYQRLIKLRKENPVFANGETIKLSTSSPKEIAAYLRLNGKDKAIVAINFSDYEVTSTLRIPLGRLNLSRSAQYRLHDALTKEKVLVKGEDLREYKVKFKPFEPHIYLIKISSQGSADRDQEKSVTTAEYLTTDP